ncbi:MAG TPA: phage holin family protein [Candidatus Onthousia faecavium]|nr:phage holin family protein [Candidatus Onthousia faecavium]
MKIIVATKGKVRLNRILEWFLYFVCYCAIFFLISLCFESFYIDPKHPLLFSILASFIIYILNQTVKPLLVRLTIPVTGLTLGLFYPFINLLILKLTDWILGSHFQLSDFWVALAISLLISVINFLVDSIMIKPIIRKVKNHG